MPVISLGTAVLVEKESFTGLAPDKVYRPVHLALEAGIRHIDTAMIYRSHKPISHVLGYWFSSGKMSREEVFITSKIFHGPTPFGTEDTMLDLDHMTPDEITASVTNHFVKTLSELNLGYVDLMLLHWPAAMNSKDPLNRERRVAAWRVLESFLLKGWARAIGVSNFNEHHLKQLRIDGAKVTPMVNQIETSVYMQHDQIIEYCRAQNIAVQAYSPLGRGVKNILNDPTINRIAEKHGKGPGQIALRFLVQNNISFAFYSSSQARIEGNMDIFGEFNLDKTDMDDLSKLNQGADGTWGLPSPYDMT